jgi:hypothetical protein
MSLNCKRFAFALFYSPPPFANKQNSTAEVRDLGAHFLCV